MNLDLKKQNLVIQKAQVVLEVGAACSREFNDRGCKPPPLKVYLMELGFSR